MTQNGRSKILEYLYKDSPSTKNDMAADLKLAHGTLDKYMTKLREEGYVKSLGNGYWAITLEGKNQYETDPELPTIQRAKDSSRIISLGQFESLIENDYYCQTVRHFDPNGFDPDKLVPVVLLFALITNQLPNYKHKEIDRPEPNDYLEALQAFVSTAKK